MSKKKNKVRKVMKNNKLACGCNELTYSDDTGAMQLCPAHGLDEAANSLARAAQALSCVADFLLRQKKEDVMAQTVNDVANSSCKDEKE